MPPLITQARLLQRLTSNPSTITKDIALLTFLELKGGIDTATSTSCRAGMMNIITSTINLTTTFLTAFDPSTSLGFVVGSDVDGKTVIIFTS